MRLQPTPKSEVSPEMKKKLRDEYLGFGGAPNQVSAASHLLRHEASCSLS